MVENDVCKVCKGTGYEIHKYMRNDGEEVSEKICCELCGGTGKYSNVPMETKKSIKLISLEFESDQERSSLLEVDDYSSFFESENLNEKY